MRYFRLCLLFSFILALPLYVGCGADKGPGKPVADQNKIDAFLAENPDENTDQDEGMEEDEDE